MPPLAQPPQAELLMQATEGFDCLLNNDLPGARAKLAANPDSPFHLVGVGISAFLAAALGQEDSELAGALTVLSKAQSVASAQEKAKRPKNEPATAFPAGTEYKLLVADSVICQALIVYPTAVTEKDSLNSIFTTLNANYQHNVRKAAASTSSSSSSSSGILPWSSKKRNDLQALRPSASFGALSSGAAALSTPPIDPSPSVPSSRPITRENSFDPTLDVQEPSPLLSEDGTPLPAPAWQGDPLATMVISGASFGYGLFGLIFSILPPRLRKLIAWFGFNNSNRAIALKLLTVAASTGDDVHGYFASLALVTFYGVVLLMSGWQAEEDYIIAQYGAVLSRVASKFPNGTLWILNRAKLCRYQYKPAEAIKIMEDALAKGSSFREADSLLVFELAWTLLSDAQWEKSAAAFLRMRTLNSWSHATYVFISAGALLELPESERTPAIEKQIDVLIDELPSLFGLKRLLGEQPGTEIFISRRLGVYKAKLARWISEGRLPATAKVREVIRISPAAELGLFWNTTGRAPHHSLKSQIARLEAFTPPPKFGPAAAASPSPSYSTISLRKTGLKFDLDSIDEIYTRDLLLGAMYRVLGEFELARSFLNEAIAAKDKALEEVWVPTFAMLELAILEVQLIDREGKKGNEKEVWKKKIKGAEKWLDDIFTYKREYELKSRLESRAQMLRDQIIERKVKLGLL
ncbi:mitochondrial outer membrane protein IML2 [Pseudohyphozyma bogoriensis]|nr:mitochondrial outer membrane protein IML2 [Pseudohyphozyma bogoriensis]